MNNARVSLPIKSNSNSEEWTKSSLEICMITPYDGGLQAGFEPAMAGSTAGTLAGRISSPCPFTPSVSPSTALQAIITASGMRITHECGGIAL